MSKKFTFTTAFSRNVEDFKNDSIKEYSPSKVKQSLSYATNINTIVDNYCKTGKLPLNGKQPIYDENFVKYDSLIEAQETVREASRYFAELPAEIRVKYGNSLEKFVTAIHSQDKFLIDKGVLKITPKPVIPPADVTPVTPPVDVTPVTPAPTIPSDVM